MHDVPWPVNFGGVVDLYYKLKWLHSLNIKIHLHCFVSKRPPQDALNKYCETVNYYPRQKLSGISLRLPYIVSSRRSDALLKNLLKDNHPILLEGTHCTYELFKGHLQHRKVFVRLHNAEHVYYERLAANESSILKKWYFKHEAGLLRKYEAAIANKASIWAVSSEDAALFRRELGAKNIHFLPVFLPYDDVNSKAGNGSYCLYHGNLSVNENESAAEWLIQKVFHDNAVPLIIAGHLPSAKLQSLVRKNKNITLIADPDEAAMQQLIEDAQVNVLPSFNNTGVKLKLLNALFNGRHCIVNAAGTEGSGLDELCSIAETADDFKKEAAALFHEPFTEKEMQRRSAALKILYSNEENARRINAWLY